MLTDFSEPPTHAVCLPACVVWILYTLDAVLHSALSQAKVRDHETLVSPRHSAEEAYEILRSVLIPPPLCGPPPGLRWYFKIELIDLNTQGAGQPVLIRAL